MAAALERPFALATHVARSSPIRIEAIDDLARLRALETSWRRLFESCPDATLFQSPDWLVPWAERFLTGRLLGLAAWRKGALVGLAPLVIEPRPDGRAVALLGGAVTDYQGALIAPEPAGDGVVPALVAHLTAGRPLWHRCELDQLRAEDPLCRCAFPAGFMSELAMGEMCPYVRLPATREELFHTIPHQLGPRLERCLRTLSRFGEVAVLRGHEQNAEELLEALFRLHAARWSLRNQPGVLDARDLREFHRDVAARMLRRGHLRIYGITIAGRVVAVAYGFAHRRSFYSYLGGFDPTLAKWSPGLVSIWQAMLASVDEGLAEFDFLRGGEPYKFRFGAHVRWTFRRRVRPT